MAKQFSPRVKELISKILNVDPVKRITMLEIMQDSWFLENVDQQELQWHLNPTDKLVATEEAVESSLGETVVLHNTDKQEEKRTDLTAFELASQLVMGSLSPLFSHNDYVHIRRNTRFMASGSLAEVMNRINTQLKEKGCSPSVGKTGLVVKGYFNWRKGIVTFSFLFFSTVCRELVLVECRRMRGDTFEFQKFYRQVVAALSDIVPCQPSAIDDTPNPQDAGATNA
jgi:5'-AMP-activated protein kinase catalytic alpha subunit